jgi:hypothetical protein
MNGQWTVIGTVRPFTSSSSPRTSREPIPRPSIRGSTSVWVKIRRPATGRYSEKPKVTGGGLVIALDDNHLPAKLGVGDDAGPQDRYRVSDGRLRIQDDHYHAQIQTRHLAVSDGSLVTVYRLVATVRPFATLPPVVVAHADFRVLPNGRARSALNSEEIGIVGSQLPARIRLDHTGQQPSIDVDQQVLRGRCPADDPDIPEGAIR